jgi:L-ribulokinase
MQVTADVLGMPIRVAASDQTVALGAGMFASVAAGVYKNVSDAQKRMGSGFDKTFVPNPRMAETYHKAYKKYVILGESLQGLLQTL